MAVVCHHSGPHYSGIIPLFNKIGWAGVDLFFVLSGFLISGLLFVEYKEYQSIDIRRFLIRRGFRIYPSFYVFLFGAGVAARVFARGMAPGAGQYLHEAFFIQNYFPGVWGHTWSLAVEEHFYIMLPIFLVLLARYSPNRENPFEVIPLAFAAVAIVSMASRALFLLVAQPRAFLGLPYRGTNFRMDALFLGVLLGYLYHFHPVRLAAFVEQNRLALAGLSSALLSVPLFVGRETGAFVVLGLTGMYLGFGGLLLLSLYIHNVIPSILRPASGVIGGCMAFLGMYSYSIYLWHLPVSFWTPAIARRAFHVDPSPWVSFFLYACASLALGIFMARMVELPALKLRERLFPSAAKARSAAESGLESRYAPVPVALPVGKTPVLTSLPIIQAE